MTKKHMSIGIVMSEFYGVHPGAWRSKETNPKAFYEIDEQIKLAKTAERGGLDYIFMPDRVFLHQGFGNPVNFPIDPIVQLSAIASHTKRIGLIPTLSTSFHEPYTIARQLRALDLISEGRAGWQVVPSFEPEAFANYGQNVPSSKEKYERLNETIQVTESLWASWKPEAGEPDQKSGVFMDMKHIQPIEFYGNHVGSRGPLQAPASPQGQPVLVMPAASNNGIIPAGLYAGAIIGGPNTIEESIQLRNIFQSAAVQAGREADDIKFMAFIAFGLGKTKREALDRRRELEHYTNLAERLSHLSMLIGFQVSKEMADLPLPDNYIKYLKPHPGSPKSELAVKLAKEGYSPLDIIAHGVLDMNPGLVGTPEEAADYLQEWFEAGAADSFAIVIDKLSDGLSDFVDYVVPILKERGYRPEDYLGSTLREHLGLPYELGIDPRIINNNTGK